MPPSPKLHFYVYPERPLFNNKVPQTVTYHFSVLFSFTLSLTFHIRINTAWISITAIAWLLLCLIIINNHVTLCSRWISWSDMIYDYGVSFKLPLHGMLYSLQWWYTLLRFVSIRFETINGWLYVYTNWSIPLITRVSTTEAIASSSIIDDLLALQS